MHYFKNYTKDKLKLYLFSIDLTVNVSSMMDDEVIFTIRIRYDGEYLGQYKLVFDLAGNEIDDVFVIE